MTRFDSLKDAIIDTVQEMIGQNSQDLYYSVRDLDEERIVLEFARWDAVKKAYVPVGPVDEDSGDIEHMRKLWHRKAALPKVMREAEEIASRAYQSHMDWGRKAAEKGL